MVVQILFAPVVVVVTVEVVVVVAAACASSEGFSSTADFGARRIYLDQHAKRHGPVPTKSVHKDDQTSIWSQRGERALQPLQTESLLETQSLSQQAKITAVSTARFVGPCP